MQDIWNWEINLLIITLGECSLYYDTELWYLIYAQIIQINRNLVLHLVLHNNLDHNHLLIVSNSIFLLYW